MIKNKFCPYYSLKQEQKSCALATTIAHLYILNSSPRDPVTKLLQRVIGEDMTLTSDLLKHIGSIVEYLFSLSEALVSIPMPEK